VDEKQAILRMRRGFVAASARQRALDAQRGAQPEQAVAELLSATAALAREGSWPAPRDVVASRGIDEVRARWVRMRRNAQAPQG
jgi:hypothetical protein